MDTLAHPDLPTTSKPLGSHCSRDSADCLRGSLHSCRPCRVRSKGSRTPIPCVQLHSTVV